MNFRYRYVGFGTTFQFMAGERPDHKTDQSLLYENEIALDVGSACWGCEEETLPIIDHHFQREGQYPSASAAVLQMAQNISRMFDPHNSDTIWLVAHQDPDFDAFCAMYLVRHILEQGMSPGENALLPIPKAFDWFHLDLHDIPAALRWQFLLASYASYVDNGRRIACPKQRALHSVLYAALLRGREYLSEDSGATEFFDEVRQAILQKQLNPLYDSVLEDSVRFQPERTLLDSEVEAYRRDVRRARKSIVHLEKTTGPFKEFFKSVEHIPLLDSALDPVAPHIATTTCARGQTDAIYLRDPECLLFKEWARLDQENSSLGAGFTFTAVAYSGGRPEGAVNQTNYIFAIDPERANCQRLYGLWARLEAAEIQALHKPDHSALKAKLEEAERDARDTPRGTLCRMGFQGRAGEHKALFADPWFDGSNYESTILAAPNRGTLIGPDGHRADLLDDPIAEIVRKELEHSIYLSPLTIEDMATKFALSNESRQTCAVGEVAYPPAEGYFRFAKIALNESVDLFSGRMAEQIGGTLWQALHPDSDGNTPTDFLTRHLVISPTWSGIWSRRGIVLAYKPDGKNRVEAVENRFRQMILLTRRVEAFIEPEKKESTAVAADGEQLIREAARLAHELTLPDNRLLSRFFEALGLRELLAALRDLNLAAVDKEKQEELIKHTKTVAGVQMKLEKLEVFIFSIYVAEIFHMLLREHHEYWVQALSIFGGGLLGFILGIIILQPFHKHDHESSTERKRAKTSPLPAATTLPLSSPAANLEAAQPARVRLPSGQDQTEMSKAVVRSASPQRDEEQDTLIQRGQ